jgi:adenine-specific DNA-methyltransferase
MPNEKDLLEKIESLEAKVNELKDHKKYGLVWEDKKEKFEKDSKDALPILREKGKDFPDIITDKKDDFNILIEGDNYHALSVLSYTHRNKIDVIYIDPPYNTGNKDFIYNDHYVDKEDRFRHSKWLSFMAKRLRLAKTLLSKDGVIFISIGEDEVAQLRLLCNLVFGERNFVSQFVWHNNVKGRQMDLYIKNTYENVLVYARDFKKINIKQEKDSVNIIGLEHDSISYYKKDYPLHNGTADFHINNRPNLAYSIYYSKSNGKALVVDEKVKTKEGFIIGKPTRQDLLKKGYERIIPKYNFKYKNQRVWRWGQEKFLKEYKTELLFVEEDNNTYIYQKKRFGEDGEYEKKFKNYINIDGGVGKNELLNIIGIKKFDNPKPSSLIKFLIGIFSKESSFILDFFAGSGTTGHAVLDFNKDELGDRKFILCTNNENKICENVAYERIKRVICGYKDKNNNKVIGLGGNLKYLKTDFVKLEKSIDTLKYKIVEGSTEILCLKENSFDLVRDNYKKNRIKVFQNKDKYTAILFDLFYFDNFVEELKKLKDKPVSVYVFSYAKDFSREEFGDLDIKFTIEAIPEKILETYKKIFNF